MKFNKYFTNLESPEPQQCTDEKCQEPECQYNMQLQAEQLQQHQQHQQQHQHQHQIIQPGQTQPHIHQIHYTYSRRTSLDSNALDVRSDNILLLFSCSSSFIYKNTITFLYRFPITFKPSLFNRHCRQIN